MLLNTLSTLIKLLLLDDSWSPAKYNNVKLCMAEMISYISMMQVGACIVSPKKKVVAVGHHDNLHTATDEPDSDLESGIGPAKKLDFGEVNNIV